MWYSPFKPDSYVDYGNMIHFALSAWTLEMSLNIDSPFSPIWWWILPTFNRPSEVQAFSAKWIIFPYSTYKLGLNGLCHIRGTFYWPQTSNLWSVYLYILFSIIFMINVGSNQTFRTFIEKSNFQTEIPNLSLKGVEVLICNL